MQEVQDQEPYRVQIGELFDGPMDLLVHLVRKNELDIYDIPIALITEQYMAYLKLVESLNIDVAGEFLVMASTLAHVKSRMLLPAETEGDEEDPRMEIVRPLEEYLQIKYAIEDLTKRDRLDWDVFLRSPSEEDEAWSDDEGGPLIHVGLFELIEAFQEIIKRASPASFLDITPDAISVKGRISEIMDVLEEQGSVTFLELFEGQATRGDLVVTFLAILEMAKSQVIRIRQHIESGLIRIFHGKPKGDH
jgi:segregation and condensation protein A